MTDKFSHEVMPRSKYKLVFVGDSSVGKTSIISRFMYDHFDTNYDATIGIDFLAKTHTVGDKTVRLQLWDTAGQERFRSLIPSYIRDSSVAVVVYAIDHRDSFCAVEKWIDEVRKERENEVMIVLVGNKNDLDANRRVSFREGEIKAQDLSALFIETSAKTSKNVAELFDLIARQLPNKEPPRADGHSGRVQLKDASGSSAASKSSCCS